MQVLAISSGVPMRRSGLPRSKRIFVFSSLEKMTASSASVWIVPSAMQLTRTLGPHSTASDRVKWLRPALAAPYATRPGDAVTDAMLEMFTIDPPESCSCITALARWLNHSGPTRLIAITDAWKRGEVGPVGATGEPPAL